MPLTATPTTFETLPETMYLVETISAAATSMTLDYVPLAMTKGIILLDEGTPSEERVSFNSITDNGDGTAIYGDMRRGLAYGGGTAYAASGATAYEHTGNSCTARLVMAHEYLNKAVFTDRASLIADSIELQFGATSQAVYGTATELYFKSSTTAAKTLAQLAAANGSDEKVKISIDDTTQRYLADKLTGGDGISVTEINGGGDEDLDIDIELATDPGLEFSTGALRVKVKAASGITRDADGLSVSTSFIESNTSAYWNLVPDDAMQKSAGASTVLPAYDSYSTGSMSPGTVMTQSHTNNGNTVVVGFHYNSASALVSSVTYGGQAMTLVDSYNNTPTGESNYFYILHNAPQGANDVVVTLSSSATLTAGIASYLFFATNATPTLKNKGTGAGSASAAVTIVVDNSWMVGWGRAAGGTVSAGANTTKRGGAEQGLFDTNGVESPGSVSLAISGTGTNAIIVAGIEPVGIVDSLDFDASAEEYADFNFILPPNFVAAATIDVRIKWLAAGSGNVVWGGKGVGMGDGEAFGNAFGSEATVTDAAQIGKVCDAVITGITLGGTAAAGDQVTLRISRKATDGSDTLAVDARMLSAQIIY